MKILCDFLMKYVNLLEFKKVGTFAKTSLGNAGLNTTSARFSDTMQKAKKATQKPIKEPIKEI